MGRHSKISSKNKSILLANDVKMLCQPLFNSLGLNAFSYSRVFLDGSRSELWSDSEALYHTFLNKKYIADTYTPDNYKANDRHIFLPMRIKNYNNNMKKRYVNQLMDQKNIFDHDNCFMIVNKNNILCEYFIFYTPKEFKDAVNFYFNKLDQLEIFSEYFKEKAKRLIQLIDEDKIIKPWRNKVIQAEAVKENKFRIKRTTHNASKLTKREMQVAQHIIDGKTAKESAILLGLSARTIETYIENIKNKYGCNRKSDLIIKLIKSDFLNTDMYR